MVNTTYGIPVVHHGGDMIGFHSDMMWLPGQDVGAVILTNADPGWILRTIYRRKLLEVLFDGKPEADAQVASQAKSFYADLAAERKLMTVPADPAEGAQARVEVHERGARRHRRDASRRDDGVRLRRVEEPDGLAQEPRRQRLVPDDEARRGGVRVRRGVGPEEDADHPRRAARVRVRRDVAAVGGRQGL